MNNRRRLMVKLFIFFFLIFFFFLILIVGIPRFLGPSDELEQADAIVAISGGDTEARTKEAVRLKQEGWAPKLLFSGAASDPASPSNAEVMRQGALQAGVMPDAIDVEELAQDTLGNASGSAKIIKERGYDSIILVTSKYHQRRAMYEFRQLLGDEVKIINHPTENDRHWNDGSWWLKPQSLVLGIGETIKTIYVWGKYHL